MPRNHARVRVFAEKDLDKIAAGLKALMTTVQVEGKEYRVPDKPLWTDELGDWFDETQLCATYKKSRGFVQYYRRRKSRVRPKGKALRAKFVPYPFPGSAGNSIMRRALLLADFVDILHGKEGRRIGAGRGGADTERLRQEEKSRAGNALKAILAKGPLPPSELLAKAAADFGITEYRVREAFDLYCERISGRFGQPYLWRLKPGVINQHEPTAQRTSAPAPPGDGANGRVEWTRPMSPTELANIFDVHYNTMITWLKSQNIRNEQVSARRYRIAKEEMPEDRG
jgi:hypothetical protein